MKQWIILLLLPVFASAQTPVIDSLHAKAVTEKGASAVLFYVRLAEMAREVNSDTAYFFALRANELAEEVANEKIKIQARLAMGKVLSMRGNYNLSVKIFNETLEQAIQLKNDSLIAVSLTGLGGSYWQLGKHAESLDNHFKALALREKLQDYKGAASSKISIAMVYQTQEKLELAEKYIREALPLLEDDNTAAMKIRALHTLANIYGMQGKIDQAMQTDREGIALTEKTNSEFSKALFYDNMGNCYFYGSPPDYAMALKYFRQTLQIDSTFRNKKQMSDSYMNIGNVFSAQKNFLAAIPALRRSVELADSSGYTQGKLKALQSLARVYREAGLTQEAYSTLQNAGKVRDSFITAGSEARMAEMQTVYETEKKQQQIVLQQAQLSKKNYILTGTIILFILAVLLGFSMYRRSKLKEQSRLQAAILKQQELATRAIIEAEEGERQRIARDLHDGVGQLMSAAKMNLSAYEADATFANTDEHTSFEKIIGLVDESCREIRNVSHNMMPNALLKNSLASAVRDFIDKLDKKSLQMHLYTEGLDERIDSNIETVLYRVLQECVNNVIRHADASSLDISIIKSKEGIDATVEDNGKGFDTTDGSRFDGIGLKNIRTRIEYLKGTVDFDSAPGRGTVVALHIPLAEV